jgi:hypothetical protein
LQEYQSWKKSQGALIFAIIPRGFLLDGQNFYRFGIAKSLRVGLSYDEKVMIDGQSRMW